MLHDSGLPHYLHAGDNELARDAILNNRQEAFSREESYRVQHWLRIVGDVATHDPELLLVQAWIAQKNTRYAELIETLAQLEPALEAAANILSIREQEILLLLAQRLNNKEIGENVFISPATVKRHAHNIYEKLGVHGRREAVAKATGLGLIPSA